MMLFKHFVTSVMVWGSRFTCDQLFAEGDMRVRETGATMARDRILRHHRVDLIRLPYWQWTCCPAYHREMMLFKHIGHKVRGEFTKYRQEIKQRTAAAAQAAIKATKEKKKKAEKKAKMKQQAVESQKPPPRHGETTPLPSRRVKTTALSQVLDAPGRGVKQEPRRKELPKAKKKRKVQKKDSRKQLRSDFGKLPPRRKEGY
jgi:hypothetical protein